jgi:hypothetical protein
MAFIHIGQKRHTVSELVNRYNKATTAKTKSRIKATADMYLSCEDLERFNNKTL